jgi:hypothetical protein
MVPTTAIVATQDRTLVYMIRDGKAEPRPVETGVRTADPGADRFGHRAG